MDLWPSWSWGKNVFLHTPMLSLFLHILLWSWSHFQHGHRLFQSSGCVSLLLLNNKPLTPWYFSGSFSTVVNKPNHYSNREGKNGQYIFQSMEGDNVWLFKMSWRILRSVQCPSNPYEGTLDKASFYNVITYIIIKNKIKKMKTQCHHVWIYIRQGLYCGSINIENNPCCCLW